MCLKLAFIADSIYASQAKVRMRDVIANKFLYLLQMWGSIQTVGLHKDKIMIYKCMNASSIFSLLLLQQ